MRRSSYIPAEVPEMSYQQRIDALQKELAELDATLPEHRWRSLKRRAEIIVALEI